MSVCLSVLPVLSGTTARRMVGWLVGGLAGWRVGGQCGGRWILRSVRSRSYSVCFQTMTGQKSRVLHSLSGTQPPSESQIKESRRTKQTSHYIAASTRHIARRTPPTSDTAVAGIRCRYTLARSRWHFGHMAYMQYTLAPQRHPEYRVLGIHGAAHQSTLHRCPRLAGVHDTPQG